MLLESVEQQAVVADSVQDLVMGATDNVQEGNEQVGGRGWWQEDCGGC